jgi:hypothetical protein
MFGFITFMERTACSLRLICLNGVIIQAENLNLLGSVMYKYCALVRFTYPNLFSQATGVSLEACADFILSFHSFIYFIFHKSNTGNNLGCGNSHQFKYNNCKNTTVT